MGIQRMRQPEAFRTFCQMRHQDAFQLAGGDLDQLAADCVKALDDTGKRALKRYLEEQLRTRASADLKGLLRGAGQACC